MTRKPTPAEVLKSLSLGHSSEHPDLPNGRDMDERQWLRAMSSWYKNTARAALPQAQEQEKLIGDLCFALWAELGDKAKKIPAYRRGRQIIGAEGKPE